VEASTALQLPSKAFSDPLLWSTYWEGSKMYNSDKKVGYVDFGNLGEVEFHESGDSGVVARLPEKLRLKGSPEDVMKALTQINKVIGDL
jgi:hypothetical protein